MANITATGAKLYTNIFAEALQKKIDLASDSIKVMLITSAKAPEQSHTYLETAEYTEVTGANYPAGGFSLISKTITPSGTTVKFDANDISLDMTVSGVRYLVIYDSTPTSNKPLIAYIDLGQDVECDGQFAITWNASGIFSITAS